MTNKSPKRFSRLPRTPTPSNRRGIQERDGKLYATSTATERARATA
jgi:hypothetical protein